MIPPNDGFTKIEWIVFRIFVLACFLIAVVKILIKELR